MRGAEVREVWWAGLLSGRYDRVAGPVKGNFLCSQLQHLHTCGMPVCGLSKWELCEGGWDQAARLAWQRPGVARWRGRLSGRGGARGHLPLQRLRHSSSQALQLRLMRPAAARAPTTLK